MELTPFVTEPLSVERPRKERSRKEPFEETASEGGAFVRVRGGLTVG
jgi:hypothetical protein